MVSPWDATKSHGVKSLAFVPSLRYNQLSDARTSLHLPPQDRVGNRYDRNIDSHEQGTDHHPKGSA